MPKPTPNIWPFSSFKRSTVTPLRSGVRSTSNLRYKGYMIYKRGPEEWEVPQLDESVFESQKEAKRFIDAMVRRNPLPNASNRYPYTVQEKSSISGWYEHNAWKTLAQAKRSARIIAKSDGIETRVMHYYTGKVYATYRPKQSNTGQGHVLIIKNPAPWFSACVEGVKAKGGAYDPQAVCGAVLRRKRGRTQGNPHIGVDRTKYQVTIEGFSNNYVSSLAKAKAKLKSLVAANANSLNGAFFEIYRGSTRMYSGRVWKGGKLSYF